MGAIEIPGALETGASGFIAGHLLLHMWMEPYIVCAAGETIMWQLAVAVLWIILGMSSCAAQTAASALPSAKAAGSIGSISFVAGTYFYVQTDQTGMHETLMTWKRATAARRKVFDLETLTPGKHASRFEVQPSLDGKYVAIGVSQGREGYSIRIVDVERSVLLPEVIARSFDGDASWSDNNKAFYYRRFQQLPTEASPAAMFTKMRACLHKLGDDPSLDKPVFGADVTPELQLPVVGAVNAFPMPGTSLLLGVQASSPKELDSFWVNDIHAPGSGWRKVIDHSDEVVFEFSSRATAFYFVTRKEAPSGRLMEFDAAHESISNAREILSSSNLELADRKQDGLLCAKDALYVYGHRKGGSVLLRVPYDDPARRAEIELPFAGVIADVSGDWRTPGFVFSLTGEAHPLTVFEYDPAKKRFVDSGLTQ